MKTTDPVALSACPCCGCLQVESRELIAPPKGVVLCKCCGLQIVKSTETEAITAWNRRTERTCQPRRPSPVPGLVVCSTCTRALEHGYPYCRGCGAKILWEGGDGSA